MDNPLVLRKSPKELSPEEYHHDANFSEVTLSRDGKQVTSSQIYFLRPLTYKDIQVTLKRFTPAKGINKNNHSVRKPGVKLVISKNPIKFLVFFLFPVMIVGIAVYMIMTWRQPENKNAIQQI